MPYIRDTAYRPSWPFSNPDINTLYSSIFRPNPKPKRTKKTFKTPDGDFLEVFEKIENQDILAILLHGLESDANAAYIRSTTALFSQHKIDTVSFNFRNCSNQNKLLQSYHCGWTKDVDFLAHKYAAAYSSIYVVGFSLGGNIALKYGAELQASTLPIKAILAVSTPIDVEECVLELDKRRNWLYQQNFLNTLKKKINEKDKQFPNTLDMTPMKRVKTLYDYDNYFTAQVYGYPNAAAYYGANNALQFLPEIKLPAVLINSKDDSFLGTRSYPIQFAQERDNFYLHHTDYGGHLGFYTQKNRASYAEALLLHYLKLI